MKNMKKFMILMFFKILKIIDNRKKHFQEKNTIIHIKLIKSCDTYDFEQKTSIFIKKRVDENLIIYLTLSVVFIVSLR